MKILKQLPSEIPTPSTDKVGYIFINKDTNVLSVKTKSGIIQYNSNDATATASQIVAGETAYVNGQLITGTLETYTGSINILPESYEQTLYTAGKYLAQNITIAAVQNQPEVSEPDVNLKQENIKYNVTINGVIGSFTGDGTISANDVIAGKIAYSKGEKIVGTLPTISNQTIQVTDATASQVLANSYYNNCQIKIDSSTLKPQNIKKNITILGIKGTLESGGEAGETTELYKAFVYYDGSAIPAHKNLKIEGNSNSLLNATYVCSNPAANEFNQTWYSETHIIGSDTENNCWVISPLTETLNKDTSLYYHDKGSEIGIGTKTNPFLWSSKTETGSNWKTIKFNTNTSIGGASDNYRVYFKVKLLANTAYQIGMTKLSSQDNRIYLYDANGNELTNNDDGSATINGVSCSDSFNYTPTTTGIYIIGAGAYSSAYGETEVVCYPAPEVINPPVLPWEITDWIKNNATSDVTVTAITVNSSAATNIKTWDGVKLIKNSDGSWKQDTVLTRNLLVKGYIPQTGKIYNANTTIYIKNLYGNNNCPISQDKLVFYTDFNYNFTDSVTGDDAHDTAGTFTNNMGLNCIKLTETVEYDPMGYSTTCKYIKWNLNYKFQTNNVTIITTVAPMPYSRKFLV